MKIKKGDTVQVLSGNDKGKKGEVLTVLPAAEKIIAKGINVRKRHVKPKKQGAEGGILSIESPIHVSKVGVMCSKCDKPVRVGIKIEEDKKVRVCKKCGAEIK
ncbi:MAG: 50S ribosomal protein L24 [Oscillospiraceae bacterium]|nr:50S ribosomal protein L24 [Oscillospiraceae bacterium]